MGGDPVKKAIARNSMEVEFANFISSFIKENLGRGPRDIRVKLMENMLVFFVTGILSPMEKNILKSKDGKRVVLEARRMYIDNSNSERIPEFERIAGAKVLEHYEAWNLEKDSAVGVVVFERDII
jgi:uncharacterized protein YbcI